MKKFNCATRLLSILMVLAMMIMMSTVAYATDVTMGMNTMAITNGGDTGIMPMSTTVGQVTGNVSAANNPGYWTSSNNMVTIPSAGEYSIYYNVRGASNTERFNIHIHVIDSNGNDRTYSPLGTDVTSGTTADGSTRTFKIPGTLKAGDKIYFYLNLGAGKAYGFIMIVEKM